jgi:hypothetical protein
MRKNIIEATETYITLEQLPGGKPFLGESPFFGRSYKADHILDEFGDAVQRIFRVNTETMTNEDITEEVARHWIYRADNVEFGLEDERKFPAYVRNSHAWACWKDDEKASAPVPAIRFVPRLAPMFRQVSEEMAR